MLGAEPVSMAQRRGACWIRTGVACPPIAVRLCSRGSAQGRVQRTGNSSVWSSSWASRAEFQSMKRPSAAKFGYQALMPSAAVYSKKVLTTSTAGAGPDRPSEGKVAVPAFQRVTRTVLSRNSVVASG